REGGPGLGRETGRGAMPTGDWGTLPTGVAGALGGTDSTANGTEVSGPGKAAGNGGSFDKPPAGLGLPGLPNGKSPVWLRATATSVTAASRESLCPSCGVPASTDGAVVAEAWTSSPGVARGSCSSSPSWSANKDQP